MERFSENVDQKAVTHIIFVVGTHWFQNVIFEKNPFAYSEVVQVAEAKNLETQITKVLNENT